MKKLAPHFIAAAALFWGFLFLFIPLRLGTPGISFDTEASYPFNSGWSWTDTSGRTYSVTLPATLPAAAGETVSLTRALPDQLVAGSTLSIRTSLQNIRVFVNGRLVYDRGGDSSQYLGRVFGSSWNLIRLSPADAGGTVTLEITSPYARASGVINAVRYGSRSALLYTIAKANMPALLISAAVFLVGLVLFIGHFLLHEKRYNNSVLLYLGLFILLVALWMAGESKMLQFFFSNSFFITSLSYCALMLLPLPYALYMDTLLGTGRHKGFVLLAWICAANLIVCTAGALCEWFDFYDTVLFTDALIAVGLLYSLVCTFYEAVKCNNRSARIQLAAVLVLLAFAVAEIFNFYFSSLLTVSEYLRIGILLFVAINGVSSLKRIERLNEADKEKLYLQKLAYTDLLTGGANRTAFYRDLEKLLAEADVLTVVQFDVNGLKLINDQYGHTRGDQAICDACDCIRRAFGGLGGCYRMGGDEFLCLIRGDDSAALEAAKADFAKAVAALDAAREYPFSVALGASVYRRGEQEFQEILNLSDRSMYENKRSSKRGREDLSAQGQL